MNYAICKTSPNLWIHKSSPKRQVLDSSKFTQFADEKYKFDENGRKFSKRVENTLGKGEMARYEQFLIFPTVFSKDLYCNKGLSGKGLKSILSVIRLNHGSFTSRKFKGQINKF